MSQIEGDELKGPALDHTGNKTGKFVFVSGNFDHSEALVTRLVGPSIKGDQFSFGCIHFRFNLAVNQF